MSKTGLEKRVFKNGHQEESNAEETIWYKATVRVNKLRLENAVLEKKLKELTTELRQLQKLWRRLQVQRR